MSTRAVLEDSERRGCQGWGAVSSGKEKIEMTMSAVRSTRIPVAWHWAGGLFSCLLGPMPESHQQYWSGRGIQPTTEVPDLT